MKHNWTKALLSAVAVATIFSACKPEPDTDTPFPPAVSPSVFMGSKNQFVYAIDPVTGVKKWETNVNSSIESSPVLYNGTLFVGNNSPILFKLDPNTGAKAQSKLTFPLGIYTTPIGNANFLYVTSGSRVTCIDIKPDTLEWSYNAGGVINSSPTIKDTQLVFGCDDGVVYMLDHRTGNLIWKTTPISSQFQSSPVMDTGNIYIGANDNKLYSLKRKDGAVTWSYTTGFPVKSSPLIYGGNVIFGSDDGYIYNLENITGTPRWKTKTFDRVRSSPYLYGQTIYAGSYDKSFYAINALDGTIKWAFKTTAIIASSPIVYNAKVYFGGYDQQLYAIDTAGKTLWKYAINGLIDCSPSVDPNNSDGNGMNSTISGASAN